MSSYSSGYDRKFFVLHSFTRRLECWHLLTCFHSAQLTGSSSDAMKLMCKVCSLVSTPVAFISDRRMTQCVSCRALPGTVWSHMRCRRFQTEVELLCGFKCSHLNLLDTWIAFVCQTLCLFAFLLKVCIFFGEYIMLCLSVHHSHYWVTQRAFWLESGESFVCWLRSNS